jgi:hypothetical protein
MNERTEAPQAQANEKYEQQTAQAADNLRQCVVHTEKESGRGSLTTDKVYDSGKLLATRTVSSGAHDGKSVDIKLDGKQYTDDQSGEAYGEDPVVYVKTGKGKNSKLEVVDDKSPEYRKVLDAVSKIEFDAQPACSKQGVDIEKDSSKVADLLLSNNPDGAASVLSRDLRRLSNEQNAEFLSKTAAKEDAQLKDGDAPYPPHLVLSDFNPQTGTFKMAEIESRHFPDTPPTRFVQPDNTLSEIARDRLVQIRTGGCDGEGCHITVTKIGQTVSDIAKENSITDINRIFVGQALKMPY